MADPSPSDRSGPAGRAAGGPRAPRPSRAPRPRDPSGGGEALDPSRSGEHHPAAESAGSAGASSAADQRQLFRAALDRKRSRSGAGGQPRDPGHTVIPPSNTKRPRTFRRRAGG